MLLYTGFNGFKQFGSYNDKLHTNTFQSIIIDDFSKDKKDMLISCAWSYTAFAFEQTILLQGLLNEKENNSNKVLLSTPAIIKQIAACDKFCLILLENGKLFKILPVINAKLEEICFAETLTTLKRNIFGGKKPMEPPKITHIAVGSNIAVAVNSVNAVFNIPSQIHQFPKHLRVQELVCGFEHVLLLTNNGDIYSWGNGIRGQLGIEPLQIHEAPVLIEALAGIKISKIAAGGWHSAAISSFGDIYTWGFNSNGQLGLRLFKLSGLKAPSVYPLPQLLDLPNCCTGTAVMSENENCLPIKIMSGARHLILQMCCGSLMVAGWNKHGQLAFTDDTKDYCDKFIKLNLEHKILSSKNLEIICGPWSTIIKNNDCL